MQIQDRRSHLHELCARVDAGHDDVADDIAHDDPVARGPRPGRKQENGQLAVGRCKILVGQRCTESWGINKLHQSDRPASGPSLHLLLDMPQLKVDSCTAEYTAAVQGLVATQGCVHQHAP